MNAPAHPLTSGAAGEVEVPVADPDWHPVARRWFDSLAVSGQSVFYEQSDWATAYLTAESLSRDLKPKFVCTSDDGPVYESMPLSGSSLSAYLRVFTNLLVTEADRRRSSIELQRGQVAGAEEVSSLDDFRRRLGGAG